MRVALVCKPNKEELGQILPGLTAWLRSHGHEPLVDTGGSRYAADARTVDCAAMPAEQPGLVIVLGGDGTLLSVARLFAASGAPILGVNLGFLGFLTEVRLGDLYATLECWNAGCHDLDRRSMLRAEVWRAGCLISSFEALNEVVVSKGDIARMGDFGVDLEGRLVARFRADGVIVSTPTGSTAYTLAAQGPILTPNVDALVVTPVCPHLLTLRPIVVRGDARLTVRVEAAPYQALLTVDGQKAIDLEIADEVRCRRSEHSVSLVRIHEGGFFEALRNKLSWGER